LGNCFWWKYLYLRSSYVEKSISTDL